MSRHAISPIPECKTISRLLDWTDSRPRDESAKLIRVRRLLDRFCPNLENRCIVKVAGTNGKGSVCYLIEAGLMAAGRTVGVFTSPHLQRVTERIRINGKEIGAEELDYYAHQLAAPLKAFADEHGPAFIPSFFEVMQLIASRMFVDHGVGYAVFEAGIGGRNDATAPICSDVAVVTTVSLDHEDRLGQSLGEIAQEKAGIASQGSTLVIGPSIQPEALESIRKAAASRSVRIVLAEPDPDNIHDGSLGIAWPSLPSHHLHNMTTAATVLRCLLGAENLQLDTALRGMTKARCPGRYEFIDGSPVCLLDGAHNEEAIIALAQALDQDFPEVKRVLVYGASRGRPIERCLALLPRIATTAFICSDFHNARDATEIVRLMPAGVSARVFDQSIKTLVSTVGSDESIRDLLVVVCGSMFLVGRVRTALGME